MADFYGNRHDERYIYKRVSWADWTERESYGYITDGTIEISMESELVYTGSFSFEGYEIPETSDMLRVYYRFTDDDGEQFREPVATLFVAFSELTYEEMDGGLSASGKLEGSSVLSVLQDKIYGAPFTVERNTNAIYKAQDLIGRCGLKVDYIPAVKVLSADHTFDANASYLDIVKWLCSEAGYSAPYPDAMGVVQLRPYEDRLEEEDALVFENNDSSIIYPEVDETNDWQTVPNAVRLLYNTDQAYIVAEALNLTGSRASLDQRGGRELTHYEEIGELDESYNKLTQLVDRAEALLRELSCEVETVKIQHAYVPIRPHQTVYIHYADKDWSGYVTSVQISLEPAAQTTTKIERKIYQDIGVEKSGEVFRGSDE